MTCKPCGPNVSAGPNPFYEEVRDTVVQDHQTIIDRFKKSGGIQVLSAWNVPETNESITVTVDNVDLIVVGSYFFNPQYGYFLVNQWNPKSNQISLYHSLSTKTAAAGTFVPANTPFLPAPEPFTSNSQKELFPFLDADFVAPFTNNNTTIQVTSTFGLRVGEYVRIGDAVYRLDGILSSKEIVIFNQGAGFTGGTTVSAHDLNGEHQYFITSEAAYVCALEVTATSGRVIICDGGDQKIITGSAIGQVPVLIDPETGEVEFQNTGTLSLQDLSVTTAKLANNAVTAAKIAAATITSNELADSSVGNTELADASISTNKLIDLQVTTAKLGDDAVTTAKILALAVTTAKLANGAVTNQKLGVDSVDTSALQNDAVETANILNLNVTTAKLAAGAVTYAKIATDAVSGSKILDESVAEAKLGGIATKVFDGDLTVSGTPNIDTGTSTYTAEAWVYGPFVICRVVLFIDFTGAVSQLDFDLPVAGYTADGDQNWFGRFYNQQNLSGSPVTTSEVNNCNLYPVTGSVQKLRLYIDPGPSISSSQLFGVGWVVYPSRTVNAGAEA